MPSFPTPSPAEARTFLASTHLFKGMDAAALDEVLDQLEWVLVPGGFCVCREGEEGDSLDPSGWTRRCLRQADHILVAAPAGAEPDLGPLGQELARLEQDDAKPREELVLLHGDADARPRWTKSWLGLRRFARHHHVRLFRPGDIQRLARFLAGREVGLVLGGGGSSPRRPGNRSPESGWRCSRRRQPESRLLPGTP